MDKQQDNNPNPADAEAVQIEGEAAAETVTTPEAEAAAAAPQNPQILLEDARAQAEEHRSQLMRTMAEMDNLRKRQARDLENAHKFALELFVSELLQVRDSLELGVSAAGAEGADVTKLREGAELTLKLLGDVMSKFHVEQVNPEGQSFNPDLHQAIGTQPRDDVPANTVVMVVQRGYTLNGRLVRPAMVMVSRAAD